MTIEGLRWLARVHGVLAWSAAVGLMVAAAAQLRRGSAARRAVIASAAAALVSAAFGLGLRLDLPYRGRLRQQVFVDAPALGWLFERKLHFSFGAVTLAWCAAALLAASAADARVAGERGAILGAGGRVALAASAVLAVLATLSSAIVAHNFAF